MAEARKAVVDTKVKKDWTLALFKLARNHLSSGKKLKHSSDIMRGHRESHADTMNGLEPWSAYEELARRNANRPPIISTWAPSSVYPTVSPEGKQIIYAVMSVIPTGAGFPALPRLYRRKVEAFFPALYEDGALEGRRS
jgi:phytoene dehydrogenase-like protein